MTSILALSLKLHGRAASRCYRGFLFDTDVQSDVETFMLMVHCNKYFLVDPTTLPVTAVGNFVYDKHWVWATHVHVWHHGTNMTYMLVP